MKTSSIKAKGETSKISIGSWVVIWVAGLAGQLAWNIENQWFNTFVYAKIAPNPNIITWMVAVSAIVSTLSTFFSGTASDRVGKRKPFIVIGYVLWGLFTIFFGTTEYMALTNIVAMTTMVVVADALMSFFGSLGNDAGFNPWTTDISNKQNRGMLGAVIAVQPVIATIIGSLLGGVIISALGYMAFFGIMGGLVMLIGIYCGFAVKDSKTLKPSIDPKGFGHQFASAFNFKLLKKNSLLLLVLCIFSVFFISFNVYFPHMLNYFIYTRGYDEGMAGILLGIGLILAIPFTLFAGKFINKSRFVSTISFALITNIIGLIVMALSGGIRGGVATAILILGIFLVGGGYMVVYQSLMIWCKNLYPENQRGQLEGVRLFFYVCVPMVFGPLIANPVIENFGKPISLIYPTGKLSGYAPNEVLFYVAVPVAILTFIPLIAAFYKQKKQDKVISEIDTLKELDLE